MLLVQCVPEKAGTDKCVHNSKNIWYKIMSIRQIIAASSKKKLQKIASQLMAYFWRYGSKRKRSCRPILLIFALCDVNNCLIDECDASVRWIHVTIFVRIRYHGFHAYEIDTSGCYGPPLTNDTKQVPTSSIPVQLWRHNEARPRKKSCSFKISRACFIMTS